MTRHDILVHEYQVGHSVRLMERIAQPRGPSNRVLATVLAACVVMLAMMFAGCGGGDASGRAAVETIPDAYLADSGGADLVSSDPDLAKAAMVGPGDLAQSIPADLATSGPVDMAQPAPADMAVCPFVPGCSLPLGATGCCNGALTCINWQCLNAPGQPCNVHPERGPVVLCYGNGIPSGQCGQAGAALTGTCLQ